MTQLRLSQDQLQAKEAVLAWYADRRTAKKEPFIIVGAAGTGKSTLSSTIVEELEIIPKRLLLLSTTASATTGIKEKSAKGTQARTIASAIKEPLKFITMYKIDGGDKVAVYTDFPRESKDDLGEDDLKQLFTDSGYTPEIEGDGLDGYNLGHMNQFFKDHGVFFKKSTQFATPGYANYAKEDYDLVIVDEIGMVTDEDVAVLIKSEVPILAMGDPDQLPPIGAVVTNYATDNTRDQYALLTEIHRQADGSHILDVAHAARTGQDWRKVASEHHKTDVWYALRQKPAISTLVNADKILATTNGAVKRYNKKVHEHLFGKDVLVAVGEKLVVNENTKATNNGLPVLSNGTEAVVEAVHGFPRDKNTLEMFFTGVILVDLRLANGRLLENVMLNTVNVAEPTLKRYNLEGDTNLDVSIMQRRKQNEVYENYCDRNLSQNHGLREIVYATYGYAVTIHKAQGKEYGKVLFDSYIPGPMKDIESNLVYTALTRAKEMVMIV